MIKLTSETATVMGSIEKGVLKDFAKFTGEHLCQSLRPATLLEKRP